MGSLAACFAAADQPIVGQTDIRKGSSGVLAGEASICVIDGTRPAYRAAPARSADAPVVFDVQEIFGLTWLKVHGVG